MERLLFCQREQLVLTSIRNLSRGFRFEVKYYVKTLLIRSYFNAPLSTIIQQKKKRSSAVLDRHERTPGANRV